MGVNTISLSVQRVRYPSFEHHHMNPNEVPIAQVAIETNFTPIPIFRIGNNESWLVQWEPYDDSEGRLEVVETDVSLSPPPFILRSRLGWFIKPDPLHQFSRKLIPPTVSILILSLFVHAIEPGLVDWGVISESFAGSYSFGPLEYPKLLFFAFPLFMIPLIIRTIANFRDFARQKALIDSPPPDPMLNINSDRQRFSVTLPNSVGEGISPLKARVQVGITVPEREEILRALNRRRTGQPSPGMSTALPEKRVASGDETGTGVGESTPMALSNTRSTILEPMRIMQDGPWAHIDTLSESNIIDLEIPMWPGTVYSALIAIHWELYVVFQRPDGSEISWVQPVTVDQADEPITIEEAPVRSGRAELSG